MASPEPIDFNDLVPPSVPAASTLDVRAIAKHQRTLIRILLVYLLVVISLFACVFALMSIQPESGVGQIDPTIILAGLIFFLVQLAFALAFLGYLLRLGRCLDYSTGTLWTLGILLAVGAFVCGLINLIIVLVISNKATSVLRSAGLRVGFLGVLKRDILEFQG